jgi:hypothetical protein
MTARSVLLAPLTIIGYRKDGRPIRLQAGGDGTSDPGATPPADLAPVVPATPPAPPATPAFDPNALDPAVKAYLDSERKRIVAEESGRARTESKANAAREAQAELLAKLGLKPDVKPEDAAAELAAERAERAASKAGADDELVSAYLAGKGRLKDLDPTASDFADKVKALIDTALTEKPSLKLATAPPATPPGGQGPGSAVVPGQQPAPKKRPDMVSAYAAHYAPKTQ